MKTVKAARIHDYGGPEAMRIEGASLPAPQTGELFIRIHAAGVNPIDWKIRAGYLRQVMPLPLPFTLGGDFSGVRHRVRDNHTPPQFHGAGLPLEHFHDEPALHLLKHSTKEHLSDQICQTFVLASLGAGNLNGQPRPHQARLRRLGRRGQDALR